MVSYNCFRKYFEVISRHQHDTAVHNTRGAAGTLTQTPPSQVPQEQPAASQRSAVAWGRQRGPVVLQPLSQRPVSKGLEEGGSFLTRRAAPDWPKLCDLAQFVFNWEPLSEA